MTETATTIGYKKSLVTFRLTPNEAIINANSPISCPQTIVALAPMLAPFLTTVFLFIGLGELGLFYVFIFLLTVNNPESINEKLKNRLNRVKYHKIYEKLDINGREVHVYVEKV